MAKIIIHLITSDNEAIECKSVNDAMFTARNLVAEDVDIVKVVPHNNDVLCSIMLLKGENYVK
tara:strand:- start:1183 stop:1371 length:189 start_codon:yes stop_codon:yes gene_type:complete